MLNPAQAVRRRRLYWATRILAFLVALALVMVKEAAHVLMLSDPLEPARAIDILNGAVPYRAEEAAQLFHLGLAPEVWMATFRPWPGMDALNIPVTGEETYSKEVLMKFGVPESAIHILPAARNTEEEERDALNELRRVGGNKIILVTSVYHTRRVKIIWHHLAGSSARALVHGAPEEPFDPDHWWRSSDDAKEVAHEYLGLLNAWAGFPLKPSPGD